MTLGEHSKELFARVSFSPQRAALLLTVLLTACQHTEPRTVQAGEATNPPTHSSVFASGAVRHPTSAAALLTNLKHALAAPLLLSEDMYEEAVLRSFFGGSVVEILGRNPPDHFVFVRGLEYLPAREPARTQISIRKMRATNAEPLTAVLAVSCSCELQLDDVEAVFEATDRTIAEDRIPTPAHLPAPPPPRNALGNLRVTYGIKTQAGYTSTLTVRTDPIGNIRLIEARQWRSS